MKRIEKHKLDSAIRPLLNRDIVKCIHLKVWRDAQVNTRSFVYVLINVIGDSAQWVTSRKIK